MASAGEFTLRAFLNGKMDLSQAEAVADLISSDNEASHQIAMQQMRGGFSNEIKTLREELLKKLIDSFAVGNVIKNGIPVAIIGEPNVGKSTLLNALLNEEKAIVSEIAGTTRDAIEDEISIGGIGFRFIDTAGIRDTKDVIESIGIKKTFEKIEQAQVIVYLFEADVISSNSEKSQTLKVELEKIKTNYPQKPLVVLVNKKDILSEEQLSTINKELSSAFLVSAKTGSGVDELKNRLLSFVNTGALRNNETIVTNSRHYDALLKALEEIDKVKMGMADGLSSDLLAIDIRQALFHMGEITGQVTNDELLGNIFADFCIGK